MLLSENKIPSSCDKLDIHVCKLISLVLREKNYELSTGATLTQTEESWALLVGQILGQTD